MRNYVIIKIGKGETTKMVCLVICEKHIKPASYRCVFLLVYFCLLIIIAIAIIKANAMIVTATSAVNSKYTVTSNTSSTIRLTSSYVGGKPHLLILFSYCNYYIIFLAKKQWFFIQNISTNFTDKQ